MPYMVIHIDGTHEVNFPAERFSELISEVDCAQDEELYVALTHDSEWSLSVNKNGLLIWENNFGKLEESWYLQQTEKKQIIDLWKSLADGKIEEIKKKPWLKGDPLDRI